MIGYVNTFSILVCSVQSISCSQPQYSMASTEAERDALDIDPIWTTSRTARQIYALGEVEKVCLFTKNGS